MAREAAQAVRAVAAADPGGEDRCASLASTARAASDGVGSSGRARPGSPSARYRRSPLVRGRPADPLLAPRSRPASQHVHPGDQQLPTEDGQTRTTMCHESLLRCGAEHPKPSGRLSFVNNVSGNYS